MSRLNELNAICSGSVVTECDGSLHIRSPEIAKSQSWCKLVKIIKGSVNGKLSGLMRS